jgi:hypothetical protein
MRLFFSGMKFEPIDDTNGIFNHNEQWVELRWGWMVLICVMTGCRCPGSFTSNNGQSVPKFIMGNSV